MNAENSTTELSAALGSTTATPSPTKTEFLPLEESPNAASTYSFRLSNWNRVRFLEALNSIQKMTDLPRYSEYSLDPEIGKVASQVLTFLMEHANIEAPLLLNQSGEALSFTWAMGPLKKYLTVGDDEIDLMLLDRKRQLRCEETLSTPKDIDFRKILLAVRATRRSNTV